MMASVHEYKLRMAELFESETRLERIARYIRQSYGHWSTEAQDFFFTDDSSAEAFGMVAGRLSWIRRESERMKQRGAA